MKELKRISAFFMAMLMMLTVFSAFSVVSAEGEAAGGTQPVWPAQGSIKLDKDAAAVVGAENLWEITLGIQGKNFETTSDVVLVIDCSGSMEGTKLTNTRKAAKAFGQKLLADGSSTRIAIVTFIDTAAAYNNGHFYDATELSAFEAAVDAATYANGGTNQQAGIHKAQELLNTSSAGLKNIVILPTVTQPTVIRLLHRQLIPTAAHGHRLAAPGAAASRISVRLLPITQPSSVRAAPLRWTIMRRLLQPVPSMANRQR